MLIRPAVATDAHFIVQLIQQSFDPQMLKAMVYGCYGIDSYVKHCILTHENLSDRVYVVAEEDDRVVGCIELRLIGETVFLNYICTHANVCHKGLGRALLREAIQLIGPSSYKKMSLDVFHDNLVAESWYERLGFTGEYDIIWWSIPIPVCEIVAPGKISGIAQAAVCQREFGFSQFSLNTTTASYSVGRLGSDWYRIFQEVLLNDNQALSTLHKLESGRRILGLFRDNVTAHLLDKGTAFARSVRMTVDIDLLLANLTN